MSQPRTPLRTPGVYIQELNQVPTPPIPVATAVTAFIGYTRRAVAPNGKSLTGVPTAVTSWSEFVAQFAVLDNDGAPAPDAPIYYPFAVPAAADADLVVDGKSYRVEPDPNTVYYLANSVRLFFNNGGGPCYIVSVGGYGPAQGGPKAASEPLINRNLDAAKLKAGLSALLQVPAPTIVAVPDAPLLPQADCYDVAQAVLMHCETTRSRIGVIDVWHGHAPDPVKWPDDIAAFRAGVGTTGLGFGVSYYPFLKTTVISGAEIDFRNLGGPTALSRFLPDATTSAIAPLLDAMSKLPEPTGPAVRDIERSLLVLSSAYHQLHDVALEKMNRLPPSGAMAGAYALVDRSQGVWKAPTNISLAGVIDVTLRITDDMQQGLNVDPSTGKSINAIRVFPAYGLLVWGARTLDGNSDDWRYVNVRRTLIMIEQSIKVATEAYVFAANDANTWSAVTVTLNNFLTSLWKQGALIGATANAAFSVAVGLGSTMTAQDILDGKMNVVVKVAVTHPAEFIVITFQQQMASGA